MKRVLRVLLVVALVVIGLPAAFYVVHGLAGTGARNDRLERARAEAASGLPAAEARLAATRTEVLGRSPVLTPTHSWRQVVCRVESRDAGFVVESYEQHCDLQSVDLVATDGPDAPRCSIVRSRQGPDVSALDIDPAEYVTVSTVRGGSTPLTSPRPYEATCPDVLHSSPYDTVRLVDGEVPTGLEPGRGWLVLQVSTSVSDTDLGCSPWGLVFCSQPVDDPQL